MRTKFDEPEQRTLYSLETGQPIDYPESLAS